MPATSQITSVFDLATISKIDPALVNRVCARSGRPLGRIPQDELIRVCRIHGERAELALKSAQTISAEWKLVDNKALDALAREAPIEYAVYCFSILARLNETYEDVQRKATLHRHLVNLRPDAEAMRRLNGYLQRILSMLSPQDLSKLTTVEFPTRETLPQLQIIVHGWLQTILRECQRIGLKPINGVTIRSHFQSHRQAFVLQSYALAHETEDDELSREIAKLSIKEIHAATQVKSPQPKSSGLGLNKLLAAQLNTGASK